MVPPDDWSPPPEAEGAFGALLAGGHFAQAESLLDDVLPLDAERDPDGAHRLHRGAFYEAWGDLAARRGDGLTARQAWVVARDHYRDGRGSATDGGAGEDESRVAAKLDP